MGGYLTVSSVEHHGSTFTFVLPYKISSASDSDDTDELSDTDHQDALGDDGYDDDLNSGVFLFQPRTLGTLFSSQMNGHGRIPKLLPNSYGMNGGNNNCNGMLEEPSSNITSNESASEEGSNSTPGATETSSVHENHHTSSAASGLDSLKPVVEREQDRFESVARETASECSSTNRSEMKHKILLVEDNKINIMVAKSMTKQLGYTIDVVSNGAEAVRAVQRGTYHLVLMDVCMPVMDGLQATRLIRSFEETGSWEEAVKAGVEVETHQSSQLEKTRKRIPIIAMTANTVSESAEECYANGMDSFVSKPITLQTLKQCLQRYLV